MATQEINQAVSTQTKENKGTRSKAKTGDIPKEAVTMKSEVSTSVQVPAESKAQQAAENNDLANQSELKTLAAEILRHKTQAERSKEQEDHSYLEMGRLLIEAKGKMKHGEWGSWLTANFEMSVRTAQKLMDTYKSLGDAQSLSYLGYTKMTMLAILPSDKRDAFLSAQHKVEGDVLKMPVDMTTREFERAVRECKGPKVRSGQQTVSVKTLSKKLSSLGTQLNDVFDSLSRIGDDSDAYRELQKAVQEFKAAQELLSNSVAKLSEQSPEPAPAEDITVSNEETNIPNDGTSKAS